MDCFAFILQECKQKSRTKNSTVNNLALATDDNRSEDSGSYEHDKRVVRNGVDAETVYNDGSSLSAIRHRADGSNRGDWQSGDTSMPRTRSEGAHSMDQGRLRLGSG